GMEVIVIKFADGIAAAALTAVLVTLFARWLTVGVPVAFLRELFRLPAGAAKVLTWAGLRGGISVALALSLPAGPERETIVALTYCVVVFSILGQGLTIKRLLARVIGG
ncbi:MAG: cation:proton antiporter, partial [Burkholderiales bacterium]